MLNFKKNKKFELKMFNIVILYDVEHKDKKHFTLQSRFKLFFIEANLSTMEERDREQ